MTDDADRASGEEERDPLSAVKVPRVVPTPCGFCHECGELADGAFCSPECRDDYDWRMKRELKLGKR